MPYCFIYFSFFTSVLSLSKKPFLLQASQWLEIQWCTDLVILLCSLLNIVIIKKTKNESMARPCFDPWLLLWLCNIDRPRHFLSGIERCKRHPPSNRDSRHHLNVCHHFRRTGKPGMTTLTCTCSLSIYLLQKEFCIKFRTNHGIS